MKKLFTISLLVLPFLMQAQITLTRADFPRPTSSSPLPDSVLYTNVVAGSSTNAQNNNGANQTWSETALTGTTAFQSFVPMNSTPLIFQLAFLSCDYAQPLLNGGNIVGGALTDAFEYYNYAASDSRLEIKGFGGNITIPPSTTGVPLPAVYSSADVIYRFPIAFGNTDSSISAFDISLPLPAPIGTVQVKRNQKRVNVVDAWGTMDTPAGSFSVLRVVSNIKRVDSLITSLFPIGFPSNPIEYKWLGSTKKVPVLQVNGNDVAGNFTPTSITFWGQGTVGFNADPMHNSSLVIYPNPTKNNCSIQFELPTSSDVSIFITDMLGKQIGEFHFANMNAGQHNEMLPISALASGNYAVTCKIGNSVLTQKLIINN